MDPTSRKLKKIDRIRHCSEGKRCAFCHKMIDTSDPFMPWQLWVNKKNGSMSVSCVDSECWDKARNWQDS